jgi:hypothetical protein
MGLASMSDLWAMRFSPPLRSFCFDHTISDSFDAFMFHCQNKVAIVRFFFPYEHRLLCHFIEDKSNNGITNSCADGENEYEKDGFIVDDADEEEEEGEEEEQNDERRKKKKKKKR